MLAISDNNSVLSRVFNLSKSGFPPILGFSGFWFDVLSIDLMINIEIV
jgi:hypothetical protein